MTKKFVFPPHPAAFLPIAGTDELFPVNRVFCVGRNYASHAVEMGHDPDREPPFFFLKPTTALMTGTELELPRQSGEVHHEVEMIVALKGGGRDISTAAALDHVFGYGVGIDLTLRDIQAVAKKLGRPWDVAKGFDASAPCGALVPAREAGHPGQGAIELSINGQTRQSGDINQMIWKVQEIISILSSSFTLMSGDIIMTGTPSGVGPVKIGDKIHASVAGIGNVFLSAS